MAKLSKRLLAVQFVDQLGQHDLKDLAQAIVQLAYDNGYGGQIDSVIAAVEQELLRRHQVAEIQLTTAHELDHNQVEQIVQTLATQADLQSYSYTHATNPELLGGFEARIGDQVIRDTVQHKLTKLGVSHG